MKMGFFGIEVKPGKKVNPFKADNAQGRLRLTQATLGLGSSTDRCILQCFGIQKKPIFLCSLVPGTGESCSLDLEFEEDDSVSFKVIGSRSIHLCGYFLPDDENEGDDEDISDYEDPFAEDVAGEGSDDSSEYDSEAGYEDELSDDDESDYDMLPASSVPKSGVVIEEITDDDKPGKNTNSHSGQQTENGPNEENQLVVSKNSKVPVVESEDEDGFPLPISNGSKAATNKSEAVPESNEGNANAVEELEKKDGDQSTDAKGKKRNVKTIEQGNQQDRQKKKKKQKKIDKEGKGDKDVSDSKAPDMNIDDGDKSDEKSANRGQVPPAGIASGHEPSNDNKNSVEKKKKKKKKKKSQETAEAANVDKIATKEAKESVSGLTEQENEAKASQVRTFPNGLVVEQLAIGKPDGKRAAPGKQVSVHYIGKLKNNGKIFDSNIGRAPFKFRLGIGQVIKGWDVGVNGMRIGDKRRLTIPPSMGYGVKGAGGKIPPNAWLVFEVELVDVR